MSEDRNEKGQFATGHNIPGPGNPGGKKVNSFRLAILEAVTVKDVNDVIAALIKRAITGDVSAVKEFLDRTLGKVAVNMNIRASERPYAELAEGDLVQILNQAKEQGLLNGPESPPALLPGS